MVGPNFTGRPNINILKIHLTYFCSIYVPNQSSGLGLMVQLEQIPSLGGVGVGAKAFWCLVPLTYRGKDKKQTSSKLGNMDPKNGLPDPKNHGKG